jgi:hypothetical protein
MRQTSTSRKDTAATSSVMDLYQVCGRPQNLLTCSSLVALLRALEYYSGTLILTTNRIGVFDDAFMSRVHVSLGFPDLSSEDRELIWMNNFERLTENTNINVSNTAKSYVKTDKVLSLAWNGREIRNGEC